MREPRSRRLARAAPAALAALWLLAAAAAAPAEPAVREPLFDFLLALAEGDSLGRWTTADLVAWSDSLGRGSRFPLARIRGIARRRPQVAEAGRWPEGTVAAVWELDLAEPIDRPLPYSILGYHPGSLLVARRLVLSELRLGNRVFTFRDDEEARTVVLTDVRGLRLEEGRVVLDADGWLDAALGGALDDAWALGFGLARRGGEPLGVAVSIKRDGGPIFGEIDFRRDRIKDSGGPLAGALSRLLRELFTRADSQPPPVWTRP